MRQPGEAETEQLLARLQAGDQEAGQRLFVLLYDEMRRIAKRQLARQGPGQTLQPTAVVNEAYLRLCDGSARYESRYHFCCTAAKAMRSVLVDHAREKQADKRGGGARPASLDQTGGVDSVDLPAAPNVDLVPLNEALDRLWSHDEELARVVELRFFGGLGNPDIAALCEVSIATVERRFALARAWLHNEMQKGDADRAPK